MKKIYTQLSNARQILIAVTLILFSGATLAQTTYTLSYTGAVQTLTLNAGTYSINSWGGDGYTQTAGYNGRGGYASGILTLASTQTIYIYVGGLGSYPASGVTANAWTFNGGGIGYPASNNLYGNGGGASDVRTVGGAWDNAISLANRVIVAGGGGAGRNSSYIGGNGGGSTGGTGTYFSPDQTGGPTGGTQTAGGSNTGYTSGLTLATVGKAATWDGNTLTATFLAGGGGGYYGGASGRVAGGGGSSYLGGVSSGTTIMFGQNGFVSNPDVSGNGLVLIKELCSITLVASGSNSGNPAICSGQTLTITTNAISNYSWSTGATTNSIVVAPTTNTVYSLTAMSPSNCITSANMSVTVNSGAPVLTLAATPASVCVGDSVKLNATGALTYTWSNGVNNNQLFPPSQTATYVVTGKNGCGTTTAAITVSAVPLPVAISSSTNTICSGSPVTLTVSGGSTYTWSTNQTASVIVVAPTSQTTYTVAAKKGNCVNSKSITISTNPLPVVQLAGTSTNVCAGTSVTLTASGGSSTYTWNPSNFTGTVVTDTPTSTINYQVSGSNGFGCIAGASHIVIVNPLPTITVNSSQPIICPGASVTLMAAGGHTYQWNTGAQTKSLVVNPTVSTSYTVTGTFTTTTCQSEGYFTVNVDQPTLSLSPSQTVCPGTAVTMSANGSGHNWSNGGTSVFNSVTVTTPTMYTVSSKVLTANNLLCVGSGTINLGMHPQPVVVATATRSSICKNEKTVITASGANTYSWQGTNVNGPTRTFSSNVVTTHTVIVMGTDANGCMDTAQVTVKVNACTGFAESSISEISIYPNPSNGRFTVKGETDITLYVTNELGKLLSIIELNAENGHQVQISDLPKGMYFIQGVQMSAGMTDGNVKYKLIIE